MATSRRGPLALPMHLLALLGLVVSCGAQTRYQGREIGALSQLHHGVRGRVFAVDTRTIYIQDLHYDGEGPAAYFYVGKSKAPSAEGARRLRDELGGSGPLRRYRGEGVTLALPDGLSLKDVRWFAIWCDEYAVNFGDVRIPRDLEYPKPAKVGALRGVHGVSSDPVVVVDAQTLLVPHFSYDGEAPDAKFWVGRGESPSPQGIRIPDENGKESPLRKYDKKTIVLTLPGELTVFDIGHFGVWCEAFTVDFGHVPLPRAALRNVPPSLKMLGVSPQSRNTMLAGATEAPLPSSRRPAPARLDATTYRPHLRPGTGPLQALLDQPSDHSALHRRADTYTAPQQLLEDKEEKNEQENQEMLEQGQQHDQKEAMKEEQEKQAFSQTNIQESHDRQLQSDLQFEAQQKAYEQQSEQRQEKQLHQQAYEQQKQQLQVDSQQSQPQQRVEVQAPELLELQYYPSAPEYYQQDQNFGQPVLQQRYYEQQLQQQLQQLRQLQHLQQLQQMQQQADPYQYRLSPFNRGFFH